MGTGKENWRILSGLIIHPAISQFDMPFSEYDMECIEKAKKIIDADISRHLSISFIAATTGIGTTKLKKGFKDLYGIGLFGYLRRQRMIQAEKLVITTNKTIKEISKISGFLHRANFITSFSSYYGVSPARYRKTYSAKQ